MNAIINASIVAMIVGIAGGILAAAAGLVWKRKGHTPTVFGVIAPVLISAAFIMSLLEAEGWPGWKPKESWWSLLHVAMVALIVPAVGAMLPRRWWVDVLVLIITAGLAALVLRTPTIVEQPWIWKTVLAGSIIIGWVVLEPLARRHHGALVPLGLSMVFIAMFVLIIGRMGFARVTPGLPAVAAALGMITIGTWFKPKLNIAHGTVLAALPLGGGALIITWMHMGSDSGPIPAWTTVCVAVSPLALWLAEAPPMKKLPPWLSTGMAVLVTTIIAGGAVAIALMDVEPNPYAGY